MCFHYHKDNKRKNLVWIVSSGPNATTTRILTNGRAETSPDASYNALTVPVNTPLTFTFQNPLNVLAIRLSAGAAADGAHAPKDVQLWGAASIGGEYRMIGTLLHRPGAEGLEAAHGREYRVRAVKGLALLAVRVVVVSAYRAEEQSVILRQVEFFGDPNATALDTGESISRTVVDSSK